MKRTLLLPLALAVAACGATDNVETFEDVLEPTTEVEAPRQTRDPFDDNVEQLPVSSSAYLSGTFGPHVTSLSGAPMGGFDPVFEDMVLLDVTDADGNWAMNMLMLDAGWGVFEVGDHVEFFGEQDDYSAEAEHNGETLFLFTQACSDPANGTEDQWWDIGADKVVIDVVEDPETGNVVVLSTFHAEDDIMQSRFVIR